MTFLLTFFIYAVVMMVRVDLVPMDLKQFASGKPAKPAPAATISLTRSGAIFFNKEPVDIKDIEAKVREVKAAEPRTVVYLAIEDGQGPTDRAPILQDLWDRLKDTGVNINLVGRAQATKQ
jgi:biopolymer transport protein ExbD